MIEAKATEMARLVEHSSASCAGDVLVDEIHEVCGVRYVLMKPPVRPTDRRGPRGTLIVPQKIHYEVYAEKLARYKEVVRRHGGKAIVYDNQHKATWETARKKAISMAAEARKKDNFDKLAIASMIVDRVFEWEASENQSHSGCDLGSVIFEAFRAPGKTIYTTGAQRE